MSKKKTVEAVDAADAVEVEKTVEIEFAPPSGKTTVTAKSMVLVVKDAELYVAKTQEHWPQDGPMAIHDHAYTLDAISLEDGATAVNAGLWASHIALGDKSGLSKAAGLTLYQSAADAYRQIQPGKLIGVVKRTSHGAVLREWLALEQDSPRPRQAIVDELEKRVRIHGRWAPVVYGSFGDMKPLEQPAKAVG